MVNFEDSIWAYRDNDGKVYLTTDEPRLEDYNDGEEQVWHVYGDCMCLGRVGAFDWLTIDNSPVLVSLLADKTANQDVYAL